MEIQKDLLKIEDCIKDYGIVITSLKKWIRESELSALLLDIRYTIYKNETGNRTIEKSLSQGL
jgi:hypothetical protein